MTEGRNYLRVEFKFKNAVLYHTLEARFQRKSKLFYGAVDLGKAAKGLGISYSLLMELLNLRRYPYRLNGNLRSFAQKVCFYLDMHEDILFPKSLYKLTIPRNMAIEYPSTSFLPISECRELPAVDFEEALLRKESIGKQLGTLRDREIFVITRRMGLDGEPAASLKEIADELCVTNERVRQIEAGALRKLRHPDRSTHLTGLLTS